MWGGDLSEKMLDKLTDKYTKNDGWIHYLCSLNNSLNIELSKMLNNNDLCFFRCLNKGFRDRPIQPLSHLSVLFYNNLADILVLILMIFISNEHSKFPTKVVNIIKNQNPFPVWDLSIKEMESSFSAVYQVKSAILV